MLSDDGKGLDYSSCTDDSSEEFLGGANMLNFVDFLCVFTIVAVGDHNLLDVVFTCLQHGVVSLSQISL